MKKIYKTGPGGVILIKQQEAFPSLSPQVPPVPKVPILSLKQLTYPSEDYGLHKGHWSRSVTRAAGPWVQFGMGHWESECLLSRPLLGGRPYLWHSLPPDA